MLIVEVASFVLGARVSRAWPCALPRVLGLPKHEGGLGTWLTVKSVVTPSIMNVVHEFQVLIAQMAAASNITASLFGRHPLNPSNLSL